MTLISCFAIMRINRLRIQNKNRKPVFAITNEALFFTVNVNENLISILRRLFQRQLGNKGISGGQGSYSIRLESELYQAPSSYTSIPSN